MPTLNRAVVTARMVLQAQLELQRRGVHRTLTQLEEAEPDLSECLLEVSTTLYHQMLHTGISARECRRLHEGTLTLVLVCIGALLKASPHSAKLRRNH